MPVVVVAGWVCEARGVVVVLEVGREEEAGCWVLAPEGWVVAFCEVVEVFCLPDDDGVRVVFVEGVPVWAPERVLV